MSHLTTVSSSGGGGGAVSSVNGTANRITATPTTGNVVVDIAATYVGQTSITTLGTVTTGTWNGTTVDATHGGTAQNSWTTGDLLYASAANILSKLAIGTTNQSVIVTSGKPAYGDNWGRKVLLSKQTASSSASLIFTSFVNAAYSRYELQLFNIQASNGTTVDFLLQLSQDNGATYITANYDTLINYGKAFNPTLFYGAGGTAWIKLLDNIAISGATSNGLINFYNLGNASSGVDVYGKLTLNVYSGSNDQYINRPYGSNYSNTNFNAFKIFMSTGNIASGTAILYGIVDA